MHVLDNRNHNEGKDHLLSSQMLRIVLCVHSHVSWQQSFQVGTIVIYILHYRELSPKITLFMVGRMGVWAENLPAEKPVLLI